MTVTGHGQPHITLDVTNTGGVDGEAVPQVYVVLPERMSATPFRLVGFAKVALASGQTRRVSLGIDPRLLAGFDAKADGWRVEGGLSRFEAGFSSTDLPVATSLTLDEARLSP